MTEFYHTESQTLLDPLSEESAETSQVAVVSPDALLSAALSTLLREEGIPGVTVARSFDEISDRILDRLVAVVYDTASTEPFDPSPIAGFTSAGRKAPVIALTAGGGFDVVPALLDAGAQGIVGRDADVAELVQAVTEVAGGRIFVSRRMMELLVDHVVNCPTEQITARRREAESLAPREREIVQLLTRGMTNREIAADLHVSEATVKAHLSRVMTRWQVRDRLQVVLCALGRFPVAG